MFKKASTVTIMILALLLAFGFGDALADEPLVVGVGGWAVEDTERAIEELGFTELTGIEVEVVTRPGDPSDFITQMSSAIMGGDTPYDVVDMEDEAAVTFSGAGWLRDLSHLFDDEFWDDWPQDMIDMVEEWSMYESDGEEILFRVPHNYEAQYFFYRKDWFDERGLNSPETWDEMVEIGMEFAEDDIRGITDGLTEGFSGVWFAYLAEQAGGSPYDFDEPMRMALEFTYDLIHEHEIMPISVLEDDYDAANAAYMDDRVAMMRMWPFFYEVAESDPDWFDEDKIAIALPPEGPDNRNTWAASWGWAIPVTGDNIENAEIFVEFMSSVENAPKLAEISDWFLSARHSVMEVRGDEHGIPSYMQQYSEAGVISERPFHPQMQEANNVIFEVASAYLTNQITLDEAMERGRQGMERIER